MIKIINDIALTTLAAYKEYIKSIINAVSFLFKTTIHQRHILPYSSTLLYNPPLSHHTQTPMLFSVLISLYHREKSTFLEQCLNSLCQQTLPANEIIIVFDGPLPTTLEQTVHTFQTALPIKIIKLPKNLGLGQALNEGLQHCTHEWIFRMDSDDIAHPQRFEQQCHYLQQHPEISLLGTQITEFHHTPNQTHSQRQVPLTHTEINHFAQQRNPFNHMTVAYRKSVIQNAGSYQHHLYMEDYNLWLRLLAQGIQTANLPQALVYVRTGQAMLQRRRGWRYIQSEWQLSQLKRKLKIQNLPTSLYTFLLRATPRLLPTPFLNLIYQTLRK